MGPKCNHKYLSKSKAERDWATEEGNVTLKQDVICAAGFEVGGRGHEPRNIRNAALEAEKGKDTYSTLAFLEGAQPL